MEVWREADLIRSHLAVVEQLVVLGGNALSVGWSVLLPLDELMGKVLFIYKFLLNDLRCWSFHAPNFSYEFIPFGISIPQPFAFNPEINELMNVIIGQDRFISVTPEKCNGTKTQYFSALKLN